MNSPHSEYFFVGMYDKYHNLKLNPNCILSITMINPTPILQQNGTQSSILFSLNIIKSHTL